MAATAWKKHQSDGGRYSRLRQPDKQSGRRSGGEEIGLRSLPNELMEMLTLESNVTVGILSQWRKKLFCE